MVERIKKSSKHMSNTQICFTDEQFKMLDAEAIRLGVSLASIVRIAVMNYFDNKK